MTESRAIVRTVFYGLKKWASHQPDDKWFLEALGSFLTTAFKAFYCFVLPHTHSNESRHLAKNLAHSSHLKHSWEHLAAGWLWYRDLVVPFSENYFICARLHSYKAPGHFQQKPKYDYFRSPQSSSDFRLRMLQVKFNLPSRAALNGWMPQCQPTKNFNENQ